MRPLGLLEVVREVRIKEGSSWHNHIHAAGPLPAQPCSSSPWRHHHGSPHSGLGVKSPSFSNGTSVRQVKQIMEEAVTRKFVHEDSSHIISFCGESLVVGCRRDLGLQHPHAGSPASWPGCAVCSQGCPPGEVAGARG